MLKTRPIFWQLLLWMLLILSKPALAARFTMPLPGNNIVGNIQNTIVQSGDSFASIARQFNVGYNQLVSANPDVDPDHPPIGTVIIIPSVYILPDVPHEGIVINTAEMRLYYFPHNAMVFYTYPIGIGREGWETPVGLLSVIAKQAHPHWHAPESIRQAQAARGIEVPKIVPPGPDNPLGDYAMRMSNNTYLIHGTNDPNGVGKRSSAGCIRMYPEDIEQLFHMTTIGTPINIVYKPYKLGWEKSRLYLEVHMPLEEQRESFSNNIKSELAKAINNTIADKTATINWPIVYKIASRQLGIAQVIGVKTL